MVADAFACVKSTVEWVTGQAAKNDTVIEIKVRLSGFGVQLWTCYIFHTFDGLPANACTT
jgi:hypothetical protein